MRRAKSLLVMLVLRGLLLHAACSVPTQLPQQLLSAPYLLCQLLLSVEVDELLFSLVPALPDVADPAVDQARGAVWQLQGGANGSTVVVAAQDDGLDLVATARAVKPGGVCRLLVLLCV